MCPRAIISPRSSWPAAWASRSQSSTKPQSAVVRYLAALGIPRESLRILEKRLPYCDYLAEMARHKIVLQADKSSVPGQVAGDALLCRLPCVGGDGAVDRLAFPATCGHGRSLGELCELASRLLCDPDFYFATVAASQGEARERVGYDVIAEQLAAFFRGLPATA